MGVASNRSGHSPSSPPRRPRRPSAAARLGTHRVLVAPCACRMHRAHAATNCPRFALKRLSGTPGARNYIDTPTVSFAYAALHRCASLRRLTIRRYGANSTRPPSFRELMSRVVVITDAPSSYASSVAVSFVFSRAPIRFSFVRSGASNSLSIHWTRSEKTRRAFPDACTHGGNR